jgi:hypothetical protein
MNQHRKHLTQKPNASLFNIKAYIKINRCIAKVCKFYYPLKAFPSVSSFCLKGQWRRMFFPEFMLTQRRYLLCISVWDGVRTWDVETAKRKEQTREFPSRMVCGDQLASWLFSDVGQVLFLSHLKTQGTRVCLNLWQKNYVRHIVYTMILWHVDSLLGSEYEISGCTIAIAR